jgi:hypothetical protein
MGPEREIVELSTELTKKDEQQITTNLNENGEDEEGGSDQVRVDLEGRELEERSSGLKPNSRLGVASETQRKRDEQ